MRCCRRRARRILLDYHRPNRQSHTNLGGPSSESFVYIRDHKLSLHIITRLLFEYNIILSLYTRRISVYTRIIFGRGADGKIPMYMYIYDGHIQVYRYYKAQWLLSAPLIASRLHDRISHLYNIMYRIYIYIYVYKYGRIIRFEENDLWFRKKNTKCICIVMYYI